MQIQSLQPVKIERCCMFTLMENPDIMQKIPIYMPLYVICFMTCAWRCKQTKALGRQMGISRPVLWSALDHFAADIFPRVIETAFQTISMIYNTVATVCQCVHVSLEAWQSPVKVFSFHAENLQNCWLKWFCQMPWRQTLYRSKLPGIACYCCILPKKEKNNNEGLYCESASKQPEFRAHKGNSSLSFLHQHLFAQVKQRIKNGDGVSGRIKPLKHL